MAEIYGAEAERLIRDQITQHNNGIFQKLNRFDVRSTFLVWLDTYRAIEEFINIPFEDSCDEVLEQKIINLRLDSLDPFALGYIQDGLSKIFNSGVVDRFTKIIVQGAALGMALRFHGHDAADGFISAKHAIGYFQSRRRHLVSLLYAMSVGCRGAEKMQRIDTLNELIPTVEHSCITLTSLYQHLMLASVYPDFRLTVDRKGFQANHSYETLDELFLESERTSIVEVASLIDRQEINREPVDSRQIFSASWVRNNIILVECAYAEFKLENTPFASMAELIREVLMHCVDDYHVELSHAHFQSIVTRVGLPKQSQNYLIHRGTNYADCVNSIAPFVDIAGSLFSTVTLLSRFIYYWKAICLNRNRRYQIRAGFQFEESVKSALKDQGFTIIPIKRIQQKEFDVIATLGDTIYNVQCKNNLVDLTQIENHPELCARYNRHLDRYYLAALRKEEAREALLIGEIGLSKIKHIVISRFPIATGNPRIIPYARIKDFRSQFVE